jgi:hypothetical protein
MASEFDVGEVDRLGWRQGSVLGPLLVSEVRKHAPSSVKVEDADWLVVTSHSCDILNASLDKERVVEVLRAEIRPAPPDGSLEGGRNPRLLHLAVEDGCLRCKVHERWTIPRELLATEGPRSGISGRPLRVLVEWLAKRYIRAAFPTAFDKRWKPKVKEWEVLLRRNSQWIQGVYLRLNTREELGDEQPYLCHILAAVTVDVKKGTTWPQEKDRLEEEISAFWKQFGSQLDCVGVEVLGTDEITLADLDGYQRFDADWVSFDDDTPATPALVDMRT